MNKRQNTGNHPDPMDHMALEVSRLSEINEELLEVLVSINYKQDNKLMGFTALINPVLMLRIRTAIKKSKGES